ncbi:hypothetical protein [Sigmofec virus UA08Rod_6488]|uniref:Uncharacterized protein n=1 Tax=Sigmofec virus UA08Rod_6488 TaxID=2929232 RepID=A0A976N1N3_9VIRU|nr:hypothetical protein [Sigmofec virus UA08Rod_6488]
MKLYLCKVTLRITYSDLKDNRSCDGTYFYYLGTSLASARQLVKHLPFEPPVSREGERVEVVEQGLYSADMLDSYIPYYDGFPFNNGDITRSLFGGTFSRLFRFDVNSLKRLRAFY